MSNSVSPVNFSQLAANVRLTPAQRRVLAYLVQNGSEAQWLSARDLATRVGVSQPSVTRLAHVLGFEGYGALRESLRVPTPAPEEGGRREVIARLEARTVERLASCLPDDASWSELGRTLAGSEPLVVAGHRASRYLAGYFAYLARKVHPAIAEIDGGGPDATEAIAHARDRGASAAIVVCMPRYPTGTVDLIEELDRLGYRIALVTDELMPSIPGVTPAWRLAVPVGSGVTFDSHPAALVALMMLLEAICDASPTAERRLERLDVIAEETGTYWSG